MAVLENVLHTFFALYKLWKLIFLLAASNKELLSSSVTLYKWNSLVWNSQGLSQSQLETSNEAFVCVTGPPSTAGEGPPSRITKPTVCCYFLNSQSGQALNEWGLGTGNKIEGTGQGQQPCIEFTFRGTLDSSVLSTMPFLSYALTSVKLIPCRHDGKFQ